MKSAEGEAIFGDWRKDDEDIIFRPLDKCCKEMLDFGLFKRREASWTTVCASWLLWRQVTMPGSVGLYTSADDTRIGAFFTEKLLFAYERLETFSSIPLDFLGLKVKEKPKNNKSEHSITFNTGGSILGISTVPKFEAFEAHRSPSIVIDEIGLHVHAASVWDSADACRKKGGIKIGIVLMGGTCGDMTRDAARKLPLMVRHAKENRMDVQFYLGYHGMQKCEEFVLDGNGMPMKGADGHYRVQIVDTTINGVTDHRRVKQIQKTYRELLKKTGQSAKYWKFCKSYPETKEEIFEAMDSSSLPEYLKERVSEQERLVIRNGELNKGWNSEEKGVQVKDVGGELSYWTIPKPEEAPRIVMIEPPIKGHFYCAGTDPIPYVSTSTIGSKQITYIYDLTMHKFVCFYEDRQEVPDRVFETTIILQKLYFDAPCMLEMEMGGVIYQKYIECNMKHLLAASPTSAGVKFAKTEKNKGYRAGVHGGFANGLLLTYLENHIEDIFFIDALREVKQMGSPADPNLDHKDAMRACLLYEHNWREKEKKNEKHKNVAVIHWAINPDTNEWQEYEFLMGGHVLPQKQNLDHLSYFTK